MRFSIGSRYRTVAGAGLLALFLGAAPPRATACDLCSIYTGSLRQADKTGVLVGVAEQYSQFGTIREDGEKVPNTSNEWMHSSITQLVAGYNFSKHFGIQANVPLISREYRRLEEGVSVRGDENGLGDIAIVGRASPLSRAFGGTLVHVDVIAGLKVPTGDSDRLSEELEDHHDEGGEHLAAAHSVATVPGSLRPRHGGEEHEEPDASAVHGHDLALGSGSVDGLFGVSAHASWKRLYGELSVQYVVRGNGDFDYEYANDLLWEAGFGFYLVAADSWTAALGVATSGENKGRDHQQGTLLDDTAITAVYLGPAAAVTWKDSLHADVTVEGPLEQDTTGRQIVPDYRIRAGAVWRF